MILIENREPFLIFPFPIQQELQMGFACYFAENNSVFLLLPELSQSLLKL
jgi:hypothetical protein